MSESGCDRGGAKWDRAARYLRIALILRDHPDGLSAQALADRIGVSKRTVYRDLQAMDADAELPIWQEAGKWGLDREAFLQPLALTLHEATTLFLAARMLAKASDEHDTELIGAFVKLAQILPPVLAEHIEATVDVFCDDAAERALHARLPDAGGRLGAATRGRDRVRRRRLRPHARRRAGRASSPGRSSRRHSPTRST